MKAYVYTDKGLGRYAGRFVWLSINTEAAVNAAFLKKYPIPVLPTLIVLDPKRDSVALRYAGGATVPQLSKLLDEAEATYFARARSAADKLLVTGDAASSEGKHGPAAKAYTEAIAAAPRKWSSLGRAAEALVFAHSMANAGIACAEQAVSLYPRVKGTVSAANVAAVGLSCAAGLDKAEPKRGTLLDKLEKATRETFDNPKIVLSDDDRSGLYLALIEAKDATGDDEGAIGLKAEWSAFLEGAAARAKTPEQRTVYDSHRVSAYMELGTPEKAIPMLEQSERDFPGDYNPPARLALAYKEMKEYDKALAASDRALARVYGPRKLSVLSVRADIYLAKGDPKAARETIVQAIELAKSLPEGQRSDRRIASLEKRLAGMQ
ncbi:MAG TPA: tetratricopeptide repeat protein [Thermoanaerobaculia bacterium]|nr:tetratricopeptide repeat protein [Thermoanaerobaculia bacterium]